MKVKDRGTTGKLAQYRAKRDFTRTQEPSGETAPPASSSARPRFVVQRHRARRLHYDLRFEVDGVLVSFAVPRGPTLDPAAKRLAVRTEDHPIEYLDFEGVIPAGEYGGGDVIVWDRGTYELHGADDAAQALEHGEFHVDVFGSKLAGRLVLIRRDGREGDQRQWLLLHKRDDFAVPGWDAEDHPESVVSGRTNDEVAAAPAAIWHSDRPAASARQLVAAVDHRYDEPLASLSTKGTLDIDGHEVAFTNLDKVLFPGTPDTPSATKRDLIRYYLTAAPFIIPHLEGRPINLHRYPNGVKSKGFWQKELPQYAPEWITRWHYPDAAPDESQWYAIVDNAATLAWLANYAAVELHPWTSCAARHDRPTFVLFDIDPGDGTAWGDVLTLARLHRTAFEHLGLASFPKVTGKRGIQIAIPIKPQYTFTETHDFAERISRSIGAVVPDLVSWEWQVAKRGGRARLDYTQNAVNKTIVAPYSVRPEIGAPVSMPIRWDELDDPHLLPDRWTIHTALTRLDEVGDLWAGIGGRAQTLPTLD